MKSDRTMRKNNWIKFAIFLLCVVLLEVLVFNGRAIFSMGGTCQKLTYTREGDTIFVSDMSGKPGYLYIDVSACTEEGETLPVTVKITLKDQGQTDFYNLQEIEIYPLVEKSKYLPVHSYGTVEQMNITFATIAAADIQIKEIIYDAKVPWFISVVRIMLLFIILCIAWLLRPSSALYTRQWTSWQKRMAVCLLIAVNSVLFLFLVRSNPAFLNPTWLYHKQYHQLAVAMSQGQVSVDLASERTISALKAMENPYDPSLRMSIVPNAGNIWDICYYEGKFYVYFGVVPVLLFYLPYYLLTGSAFPTWLGVFLAGVGCMGGVYYLFSRIRKKWFPELPYMWYLLLATICSNCLNLNCAMLHADFYYLPILMALCFTLWGLGLMVSVADDWEKAPKNLWVRIGLGALCLALTAGCRPQFLVGSFLLIPLFGPILYKNKNIKQAACRVMAAAVPYIVVAAGLMFYNYIRFGSVFDFGANYNLTTNDMTKRGFNLGRLPDGIFMYLFQPISYKLTFPFAEVTAFYTEYLGSTVRDWMFGGAFWTRPILLMLPGIVLVRRELTDKKIYGFTVLSMCLTLLVVVADTEMAGLLNRYCTDFLWLMLIPVAIVLMQLYEKYKYAEGLKWFVCLVLLLGAFSVFYEYAIAFRASELIRDNAHRYYLIKSLFQ